MQSANIKETKNFTTKVGIFMPCYNMGRYIDEGLNSLYGQTFQDFVVIIADDASTLKSTINKLSKIKQSRCKIYYEKTNLGLVKISNKYMHKLDTEYIMLFSPDDKMHPEFLKEQVEYLDSHPHIDAVSTWVQEFEGSNKIIKYDDKTCTLPYMLVDNHFSGAALMRKSAWLAVGMHDTNSDLYPNLDYVLWLSMLEKGFKLATIPRPLFYWRVLDKSLSHNMDAKQMLVFRKALLKKFMPMYSKYSEYVINNNLETICRFEDYYTVSEKGHTWLDNQYKNLIAEIERLNKTNINIKKENHYLTSRLNDAIELPYLKSLLRRMKKYIKKL